MDENQNQQTNYLKGVIESLLFVNEKSITVEQIKKLLSKKGLSESEYEIYSQKSGQKDENVDVQTIIEINKKV